MSVQVNVEKFGAFYNEGARGARGGSAQNDKVWGLATINNTLVAFWGRRNGKLRFKTYPGVMGREDALNKWDEKVGGRRDGGDVYMAVQNETVRSTFCPTLKQDLVSFYYSDMAKGKINTRH